MLCSFRLSQLFRFLVFNVLGEGLSDQLWQKCIERLQDDLPTQQFNTWIRPLQDETVDGALRLFAPNRFVLDWVNEKFLARIKEVLNEVSEEKIDISLLIGSTRREISPPKNYQPVPTPSQTSTSHNNFASNAVSRSGAIKETNSFDSMVSANSGVQQSSSNQRVQNIPQPPVEKQREVDVGGKIKHKSSLNPNFTFDSFVEGKSNQLARAAASQVAENPGGAYNPLFLYGGVGLGKTHLMHAVGNFMGAQNKNARIVYLHSERFVADMVKALQINAINEFKRYYRSVDALLIDDIQFFAGKERSQEEFFHTFNALLEGGQQMILTCDRYPKEIIGVEERLKSRFGWGLTVAVEPPELETRVAILMKKAEDARIHLPDETAFFIAQKIRSNVRELEGALKRVIANSKFMGKPITLEFVKESLKDLLALQDRQVSIDNIQKTVAEYFKIKVSDLHSKRRSRSVARPRQVAMALSKELTNHSLPEIGDAFGGRDHTTVLHACRKVKDLRDSDADVKEDYTNLTRLLTN